MTINKRLLAKSMIASVLITALLMVISYLPLWNLLSESEKSVLPLYLFLSSFVVFCILTAIFYLDVRKILERKSP